jgi:hypothetical protein
MGRLLNEAPQKRTGVAPRIGNGWIAVRAGTARGLDLKRIDLSRHYGLAEDSISTSQNGFDDPSLFVRSSTEPGPRAMPIPYEMTDTS